MNSCMTQSFYSQVLSAGNVHVNDKNVSSVLRTHFSCWLLLPRAYSVCECVCWGWGRRHAEITDV